MGSATVGGTPIICPTGCSACSSATVCTSCNQGLSLSGTTCVQCDKSCATCSTSNPTECYSCAPGLNLYAGACLTCSDSLCLDCQNNYEYCVKCKPGYTSVNGVCQACTKNCLKCDTTGANYCDVGECAVGFTRVRSDSCTQCLLGCAQCLSTRSLLVSTRPQEHISLSTVTVLFAPLVVQHAHLVQHASLALKAINCLETPAKLFALSLALPAMQIMAA